MDDNFTINVTPEAARHCLRYHEELLDFVLPDGFKWLSRYILLDSVSNQWVTTSDDRLGNIRYLWESRQFTQLLKFLPQTLYFVKEKEEVFESCKCPHCGGILDGSARA